ncbi:MAG: hypothetical protein HY040_04490 [Planctomycetes bacterium]|nr:hypothetical protein [Planctomycetota bacterium]
MLEDFLNHEVVLDLRSPYVCLGKLAAIHEVYFELRDADLHDLRDSKTSREDYVAAAQATGIKRNRERVLVRRDEVVAIAKLAEVVDQ